MGKHVAILDIGSSKIICLICSTEDDGSFVVRGAGVVGYAGFRYGKILSEKSFKNAIRDAITKAENDASRHVKTIIVGVPSPFSKLIVSKGAVELGGKSISVRDIDRMVVSSFDFEQPAGFEPIHDTPIEFNIDGTLSYDMPLGVPANELSGMVSHLYVDSLFKKLIVDVLSSLRITASEFISVPLAEGRFVVSNDIGSGEALVVDVGSMHTDVVLMRNTAVADMRTLDVGGYNFTSDIAYIFDLPIVEAEKQKRNYVYALDYTDSVVKIKLPEEVIELNLSAISEVIDARTYELADMIEEAIVSMGVRMGEITPIYLTGGGISLMRGCTEFISDYFGVKFIVNMPWMPRLSSPNYASAFALMRFAMSENELGRESTGFWQKIKDFLTN